MDNNKEYYHNHGIEKLEFLKVMYQDVTVYYRIISKLNNEVEIMSMIKENCLKKY